MAKYPVASRADQVRTMSFGTTLRALTSKGSNLIVTSPANPKLDPPHKNQPQERSLPDLTDIIEFLERIQCSHPFIQRIAIRLYSWAKGIDQRHLYRIASIRSERGAL